MLAEQGLSDRSPQSCLAENYDRAAGLIEKAGGGELILYGEIGFLRNLLRHIPEENFKEYPRMQIARAYLFQKKGRIRDARNNIGASLSGKKNHIDFSVKG